MSYLLDTDHISVLQNQPEKAEELYLKAARLDPKNISLKKGRHTYTRNLTIRENWPVGRHMLGTGLWRGPVSDSRASKRIASGEAAPITIVE